MTDPELWQKIEEFEIGPSDATLSFAGRLARENNWTLTEAGKAILEYKRFIYLAATSDGEVTPSDVVDQVWHLHLTYTQSYWDELCGTILNGPLHHGPTQGGQSERKSALTSCHSANWYDGSWTCPAAQRVFQLISGCQVVHYPTHFFI